MAKAEGSSSRKTEKDTARGFPPGPGERPGEDGQGRQGRDAVAHRAPHAVGEPGRDRGCVEAEEPRGDRGGAGPDQQGDERRGDLPGEARPGDQDREGQGR